MKYDKDIKEIVEEKKKWQHFFEILSRKYIYIPGIIVALYLIDNPDINILKFLRRLAGVH